MAGGREYTCTVVVYRSLDPLRLDCGRAKAVEDLQTSLSRTHVVVDGYVSVCLKSRVIVTTLLREAALTPCRS
jgi:hypothetical protein